MKVIWTFGDSWKAPWRRMSAWLVLAFVGLVTATPSRGEGVAFNRDVRPILSENCFQCHGFDSGSRKAGLRLDRRERALEDRDGVRAINLEAPEKSELLLRVRAEDPDDRMPPSDSGKSLTERDIAVLEQWIREGAVYESHWSYIPPERPKVPESLDSEWGNNKIDAFIWRSMKETGVEPSERSSARNLVRRLYLDILGLPPTHEEIERYLNDRRPDATRRLIRELTHSPHFGERMAMDWLDWVRYADTVGYHGDQNFSVSPYRDYVINAFNSNKPFDEFTREQIAGDLMPGATQESQVASAYNRLLRITAEGGAQDKEYLAKYAADRVRTTSAVWLGSTMGCAECHDHKFDPFSAEDFYSFAAYFADLQEKGFYGGSNSTGRWGPQMRVPDPEEKEKLAELNAKLSRLERVFSNPHEDWDQNQARWEAIVADNGEARFGEWALSPEFNADSLDQAHEISFIDEASVGVGGDRPDWEAIDSWASDGPLKLSESENASRYLYREIEAAGAFELRLALGARDHLRVWFNGVDVLNRKAQGKAAADQEKLTLQLAPGKNRLLIKTSWENGVGAVYYSSEVGPNEAIRSIVGKSADERSDEESRKVRAYFRDRAPELAAYRERLDEAKERRDAFEGTIRTTLVSKAREEPRLMRVLPRGNWMDDSGKVVQPRPPEFLMEIMGTRSVGDSRIDLADWLVDERNPLTARTFVNRLWHRFFGAGLAPVLDDLGAQGSAPTHPELLDWLAVEFMESGWNVKHIVELIVSSAAYQQTSMARPGLQEVDPFNRLYARQSRFRVPAEVVRDIALRASGLLQPELGGVSVKPYQPAGYYAQLNFPRRTYERSEGRDQYRRGVYTHWQRTFLHPMLVAFDAPNREECVAERPQSNTPLQALALLNDPSFVEAARVLGGRMWREGAPDLESRIRWGFEAATSRSPEDREVEALKALYETRYQQAESDPSVATEFLSVGQAPSDASIPLSARFAMASVARGILNLHETISRY